MDDRRFDAFTKHLAETPSRRRVLKGLAGGIAGGLLVRLGAAGTAAAKCAAPNVRCRGVCCPAPTNGTATCADRTCGIACNSGYVPCNGACVPGNCCTNADCAFPDTCGGGGVTNVCGHIACVNGTCPAGQDCLNDTCSCHFNPCASDSDCVFGTESTCQAGGNGLSCCCIPNGAGNCAPGPNGSCCSGYCDTNNLCAAPPA